MRKEHIGQNLRDSLEVAEKRAAQMAALAVIMQDSLNVRGADKKALQDTIWLMSDLLNDQHEVILHLQKSHFNS
jgi:hypothetical protein